MKKYVLNIDRLYSGQTANALVLNQVDEDMPVLVPSLNEDDTRAFDIFADEIRVQHPDFKPEEKLGPELTSGWRIYDLFNDRRDLFDKVQQFIFDFNLDLQTKFKEKGHQELYMMDDTLRMKPIDRHKTQDSEKTYMHCLDGKAIVQEEDDNGDKQDVEINSSQLNVIFPYRKMSSKSLYANQINVWSSSEIDDILENARGITLQGKVSYEDCMRGVAQVGNNIYVMSSNVDIGGGVEDRIHGNGLTIVNSRLDRPYYFPNSMTLFQPSQDQYDQMNLAKDSEGKTNFIRWYEKHSRKTVVSLNDEYGGNVSTLRILGKGSYELDLATYSPTNIIQHGLVKGQSDVRNIHLVSDTYRDIRKFSDYQNDKYVAKNGDVSAQYIIDNGQDDYIQDELGNRKFSPVGIMFNMYDTFITGSERILQVHVPRSKDFNDLDLQFEWEVRRDSGLIGDFEAIVTVGDQTAAYYNPDQIGNERMSGTYSYHISNAAVDGTDLQISVKIHYGVDFGRRNTSHQYRDMLKSSGVVLKDIRISNGLVEDLGMLTFGSYVNETGITEDEHIKRMREFWEVSQYKRDMMYQTVVESALKNVSTAGIRYKNNYSSGDMYGDVFVTKSVLDPRYDMNIGLDDWDETTMMWKSDGSGELDSHQFVKMLHSEARDYIGLGECSNQLSLMYKPIDVAIGYSENDDRIYSRRTSHRQDDELKYQMVEVVKNINKFETAIKHKSNVFSVVVENSNLAPDDSDDRDETLEQYKEKIRQSVTQFVRNVCEEITPVHTQLFDVQFT